MEDISKSEVMSFKQLQAQGQSTGMGHCNLTIQAVVRGLETVDTCTTYLLGYTLDAQKQA